jgi:DNA-directed RNA polymerase I subunit RPA2
MVYSTEIVELNEKSFGNSTNSKVFALNPSVVKLGDKLDSDGLPFVGSIIAPGDPFYCYLDTSTGEYKVQNFKKLETAYIESVRALGSDDGNEALNKVAIMMSFKRNPIIGDKFSSRHGQKGICSRIYPTEDLPFTESGLTPDIIFNPHGFPSRMTIGMMIEFMAGKSGSLYGTAHDSTPFQFEQSQSAIDYYGKLLQKAGYNYYGTESMYSGINGRQLEVDIFFGVVYYQRLRHMVSDKFQVRTTGPIDVRTHQPVKGRKREGGIRFGEMERDALLAHGTSAVIQDRLLNCSDKTSEKMCTRCGSLISISKRDSQPICLLCGKSDQISSVCIPYVLKYLVAELASVNIRLNFETKQAQLTNYTQA